MNKRIRMIITAGALAAIAVMAAPPVLQEYKDWQAKQLSAEALTLLEKGELSEAAEQIRLAYFLAPQELSIVRAAARIAQASSPEMALPMWKQAVELSGGDLKDRLGLCEAAVEAGHTSLAEGILPEVRKSGSHTGYAFYLEARMLALQGRTLEAADVLRNAWSTDDVPEKALILFAQIAQNGREAELTHEAQDILRKRAGQDGEEGLTALRLLANWREPEQATMLLLSQRLREHPLVEREDVLGAILADERLGKLPAASVATEAKLLFDLGDEDELLELTRWLIRNGRCNEALGYIEKAHVNSRGDLFQAWAEAMYQEGRLEELTVALNEPEAPVAPPLRHLFRMRVFRAQENMREARLAWESAMVAAAEDSDALWMLAHQTMKQGLREQAREALWKLSTDMRVMRTAYQGLLEIEQSSGNTRGLLKVLTRMSESYPKDNAIKNDFAYVKVLLNEDVEEAISEAEALVAGNDSVLSYRVTLACGRMRQGKNAEALKLLEDLEVNWGDVNARWQIVLAWILLENGQEDLARELLREVDEHEPLLPEERGLLTALQWELEPGIALPFSGAQS